MSFSDNLDRLLTEKHISNYRIAKDTGVSDSLIGYWRKGTKQPTLSNLMLLCDYLEVSVDYLTGYLNTSELKLITDYRSLNKESQRRVTALIRDLKRNA